MPNQSLRATLEKLIWRKYKPDGMDVSLNVEELLDEIFATIKRECELMKKEPTQHPSGCPDGQPGCLVYHFEMKLSSEDKIWNSALSDLISKLK